MLKVSEKRIYGLIKEGKLQKVNGLGRTVRIPESEIKRLKNSWNNPVLSYDPEKVDLIDTYLGGVRKLKDQDFYVLRDFAALIPTDSGNIKNRVHPDFTKLISYNESTTYGIPTNKEGSLLINFDGIKEYSTKCKTGLDWDRLMKELTVNVYFPVVENETEKKEICLKPTNSIVPEHNNVTIFGNVIFGNLRVLKINEKPYFVGNEVARALEYQRPYKAVSDHCKGVLTWGVLTNGGEQDTKIIPEGDVFRLIIKAADQSKNPAIKAKAEKFESWIFDEILPSIYRTGGYVAQGREEDFIKNYLDNFSPEVKEIMVQDLKKNSRELKAKLDVANKLLAEIER